MKKIIIIILLLTALIKAQVHDPVNTKPLIDYPTVSSAAEEDFIPLWDLSADNLYKWKLVDLKNFVASQSDILTTQNHWTNYNTFDKLIIGNTALTSYVGGLWYSTTDSTLHAYIKNASNDKFQIDLATKGWVYAQNFGSGTSGSYWSLSGDQSGISGTKSISSGGISLSGSSKLDFGVDLGSKLVLPIRETASTTLDRGQILFDRNNNYVKVGDGTNNHVLQDEDMVKDIVKETIITDVYPPNIGTNGVDTLDWNVKNYAFYADIPPEGPQTYVIKNYGPGQMYIMIKAYDGQKIDFEIPGITPDWALPGKPEDWGGKWDVVLKAAKPGEVRCTALKYGD